MPEATPKGRFVWYDLMTSDPDAAVGFYTDLIGWGTQDWSGGGDHTYTMWTARETPIGGVMRLPEEAAKAGAPPHWLSYVCVPDVAASAKQAEDLGADTMVPPTDIPTVGRFAVLSDPQGAVFALFSPESDAPGHEGPPEEGEFSWHELATTDHEAAFEFYGALFGWEKLDAMDMGEAGMYQMYGRNGIPLGGMFKKPAEVPGPPAWLYYAKVSDVRPLVEKVKERGGQVLNGPMEVPGGDFIVQCMDPQGAMFALHSTGGQPG
jgi:uncharacterized protein